MSNLARVFWHLTQVEGPRECVFDWQQLANQTLNKEPTCSYSRTSNTTIFARPSVYHSDNLPFNVGVPHLKPSLYCLWGQNVTAFLLLQHLCVITSFQKKVLEWIGDIWWSWSSSLVKVCPELNLYLTLNYM